MCRYIFAYSNIDSEKYTEISELILELNTALKSLLLDILKEVEHKELLSGSDAYIEIEDRIKELNSYYQSKIDEF